LPAPEDHSGVALADVNLSIKWSATSSQSPCITSGSRIWIFNAPDTKEDERVSVGRELKSSEALALQGYPLTELYPAPEQDSHPRHYMDLAGNAFCGPVVGAVLLASFAAHPWGAETADPEPKDADSWIALDADDDDQQTQVVVSDSDSDGSGEPW
jgi:hypothetical protein